MVLKVKSYAHETHGAEAIVISARIEEELIDLSSEEASEFLQDMGITDSGVSTTIRSVYQLLGLALTSLRVKKRGPGRLSQVQKHLRPLGSFIPTSSVVLLPLRSSTT